MVDDLVPFKKVVHYHQLRDCTVGRRASVWPTNHPDIPLGKSGRTSVLQIFDPVTGVAETTHSVSRQFVLMCQQLGMFTEAVVAIDGSKFKAVNNHDRNFTAAKLQYRMKTIEDSINRYLKDLDTADRHEPQVSALKTERLQGNIAALKAQMQRISKRSKFNCRLHQTSRSPRLIRMPVP
jgi:hypothetical protein